METGCEKSKFEAKTRTGSRFGCHFGLRRSKIMQKCLYMAIMASEGHNSWR